MTPPPFSRRSTLFASLIRTSPGEWFLPTLARFTFAAVLLVYFWNSALTKVGDGIMGLVQPSVGAYAQIFPKAMEAAQYDISQLSVLHYLVVLAGTWAEFILPAMIVVGFLTRLAAFGMVGFVLVQSYVDVVGHGRASELGAMFDGASDSLIVDQRLMWGTVLAILVVKGAGPLSIDKFLVDDS